MKKIIISLFLLFSQLSIAQETPDILIYSRTSSEWNVFLLEEFRILMNNIDLGYIDPKQINLSDPIIYSNENIKEYVTDDLHDILKDVGRIVGLNYAGIKAELIVNKFGYSITKIVPRIKPLEGADGNVTLHSTIGIEGLEASASDILLQFSIQGLKKKPTIRIPNPTIVLKRGTKIDFDLDLKFIEQNNRMKLDLQNGNFSRITEMLTLDHELIDIIFDESAVEFPKIEASFGGRDLSLNHERVISKILENKDQLKVLLFDQLHELFKRNLADSILKKFDNISFPTGKWIESDSEDMFPVFLRVLDFSVPFKDTFLAEVAGDFCTQVGYVELSSGCIHSRLTSLPIDVRTEDDLAYSQVKIKDDFKSRADLKFVASISENYLNKSIVTSLDSGMWNSIFEQVGIKLGDQKILLKVDEEGDTVSVLVDVIYALSGVQSVFLLKKYARFPVILKAKMRVENGISGDTYGAQVVFSIYDIDLDEEILKNGHKKYGFPSNIKNMNRIFRRKVINTIKKELVDYDAPVRADRLKDWQGIDLPAVPLPQVNNMHLEMMKLNSDGRGRVSIIFEGDAPVLRRRRRGPE